SSSSTASIIYAKKYQSPGDILVPILMVLGGIVVVLLAIQIFMSLFNAAIAVLFMIFLLVKVALEFVNRPIKLLRTVHSSPVLYMTILGATLGSLHSLWQQCLLPLLSSSVHSGMFLDSKGVEASIMKMMNALSMASEQRNGHERVDHIMIWGLLKGVIIGIEVGCLWLVVFGDASNPTAVSKYMHRRVWRHLKRQYRQSAALRQNGKSSSSQSTSSRRETEQAANDDGVAVGGDHRNQCAICFEAFQDVVMDDETAVEDDDSKSAHPFLADRYQLLPCAHCFHRECARHWLSIQRTCPVCREKVEGMRGYNPEEHASVDIGNES
ncbi:MAG: hypothetical protein SGILL_003240, partial [Bacillariaceae sp.]